MSSPFSMLSMLSKARRSSSKRTVAAQENAVPEQPTPTASNSAPAPTTNTTIASTTAILDSDFSDTASVISKQSVAEGKKDKKKRTSGSLLRGLSRGSSVSVADFDDTASIISKQSDTEDKKSKKKRSPGSLFKGLSRRSSKSAVVSPEHIPPIQTSSRASSGSGAGSSLAVPTPLSPIEDATPIATSPPMPIPLPHPGAEEKQQDDPQEMTHPELKSKGSSDGFSVVNHSDREGADTDSKPTASATSVLVVQPDVQAEDAPPAPEHVDQQEGDWTEVLDSFPTPPPVLPPTASTSSSSSLQSIGATDVPFDRAASSFSFYDAEELPSTPEPELSESALLLQEEVKRLSTELEEVDARHREKEIEARGLSEAIVEKDDHIRELSLQVSDLKSRETQQKEENRRLVEALGILEASEKKSLEDSEKVTVEIAEMRNRILGLTKTLDAESALAQREAQKVTELEALIANMKAHWKGEREQARRETEKVTFLAGEIREMTKDLEKERGKVQAETEKVAFLEQTIVELRSDMEKEHAHARGETEKVSSLERTIAEMGQDMEAERERFRSEVERLNVEKMTFSDQLWDAEVELQAQQTFSEEARKTEQEVAKERIRRMKAEWEEDKAQLLSEWEERYEGLREEKLASTKEHTVAMKAVEQERDVVIKERDERVVELAGARKECLRRIAAAEAENVALVKRHGAEMKALAHERDVITAERDKEALEFDKAREQLQQRIAMLEEEKDFARDDRDAELEDLRRDLLRTEDEKKARIQSLEQNVEELRGENADHTMLMDNLRAELVRTIRELKSQLAEAQRQAAQPQSGTQIEAMKKQLHDAKVQLASGTSTISRLDAAVTDLRANLADALQQQKDRQERVFEDQRCKQASDTRFKHSTELRGVARLSVEPVDAAARITSEINSESFQCAASMTDTVESETTACVDLGELEPLIERLSPMLSKELIVSLRSAYTEPSDVANPLLLQVAIQACLVYCCHRFIMSWYPFHWEYGTFLELLHDRLLESGTPELAESWRSSTRPLLRLTSESHPQLIAYIRESILDVLAVVGRSASDIATQALLKDFENKFSVLARLAIRMHLLLNDNAPSDLETFIPQPSVLFNSSAMEDTYADEDDDFESNGDFIASLRRVICTSDIGLRRSVQSTSGRSEEVLLKPKVVLHAILNQDW